ncbi:MAG: serine--tRNA ligase, partial [Flavobacteriaceae bacterium CG_4_10_14_3_um_filter_33_47]
MLQVPFIRDHKELVIAGLAKRNIDASGLINDVISFDEDRRRIQTELDSLLAESNTLSKEIGNLYKSGEVQKANILKEKTSQIKETTKELNDALINKIDALNELLYKIPNVPNSMVSPGKSEADNEEVYKEGDVPVLHKGALPHWELAKKYDIIDFELGNKITGAGFPVYKGKGAKLQRALITYFLDKNTEAGYTEYQLPHLVNEASGFGTGQLPDK